MNVTDPICNMTIDSDKAAATETWQGKTYYFCSTSCADTFRKEPDRYVDKPGGGSGHGHGGHGH
ncbi:MAG: YHS domain-containing protein [Bacteroidetes bacterium]|nr:YHS domain-containing protein [Bacteroidota bacterium]